MMGPEASGSGFFTQPTYRRLPPYVIFHAGGDQTVIRVVSEDRPHRPKVDHLAGLGLRGGGRSVNHRLPAETKLGHAHWLPASRMPWLMPQRDGVREDRGEERPALVLGQRVSTLDSICRSVGTTRP